MSEYRFSNKLGEDYDLFSLVLPHQNIIQKESVSLLRKNIFSKNKPMILEIGFGTGITTKEILNSFKEVTLVSIDNELEMLPKAKERIENEGFDGSCLIIADAISFLKKQGENSLDGVISVWTIHNLLKGEQKEILEQIFRVLKPGGAFINGDKVVRDDVSQYQKDFEWQMEQFNLFSRINRSDLTIFWKQHYEEDANSSRKITELEYKEIIKKVGFSKIYFSNRNYLDVVCIAIK